MQGSWSLTFLMLSKIGLGLSCVALGVMERLQSGVCSAGSLGYDCGMPITVGTLVVLNSIYNILIRKLDGYCWFTRNNAKEGYIKVNGHASSKILAALLAITLTLYAQTIGPCLEKKEDCNNEFCSSREVIKIEDGLKVVYGITCLLGAMLISELVSPVIWYIEDEEVVGEHRLSFKALSVNEAYEIDGYQNVTREVSVSMENSKTQIVDAKTEVSISMENSKSKDECEGNVQSDGTHTVECVIDMNVSNDSTTFREINSEIDNAKKDGADPEKVAIDKKFDAVSIPKSFPSPMIRSRGRHEKLGTFIETKKRPDSILEISTQKRDFSLPAYLNAKAESINIGVNGGFEDDNTNTHGLATSSSNETVMSECEASSSDDNLHEEDDFGLTKF